jgi:predicted RNase H-like nuclease
MFAIMQDAEDAVKQMNLLEDQLTQRKAESSDRAEQDKLDSLIALLATFRRTS